MHEGGHCRGAAMCAARTIFRGYILHTLLVIILPAAYVCKQAEGMINPFSDFPMSFFLPPLFCSVRTLTCFQVPKFRIPDFSILLPQLPDLPNYLIFVYIFFSIPRFTSSLISKFSVFFSRIRYEGAPGVSLGQRIL